MPNKFYGGLGGMSEGRGLNHEDLFEMTVEKALGDRIRGEDDFAVAMWSALSNVEWFHVNGDEAGYSFRAAGDLVAAVRGEGNYMDWYCSGPAGCVHVDIEYALGEYGWYYEEM